MLTYGLIAYSRRALPLACHSDIDTKINQYARAGKKGKSVTTEMAQLDSRMAGGADG